MYYVYILISERDRKLYICSTHDLRTRLKKHESGFVRSTKFRRPLRLLYYEAYIERRDAQRRELFLKGGNGHKQLQAQLRDTYQKSGYLYL